MAIKAKSQEKTYAESALHLAIPGQMVSGLTPYTPPKKRKTKTKNKSTETEKNLPRRRNTPLSDEHKKIILEHICAGETLPGICRSIQIQPAAVYEELIKDNEFAELYTRARERQADFYVDEIIDIADNCTGTLDDTNRAKVQIDARKWACAKLHPRKYSDKAQVEVSGANGAPLTIAAASVNIDQLNAIREQLNAVIDITAEDLPQ